MKPSLESLCALKQRERQEDVTGLRCMLCKDVLEGKRAVLFEHLWQKHHFFIGSADNVIFIDEFMAELHQRLHEKKQCLKCDKTFGNYDQLRLHMRKKRHLDISGKTEFDRFYLSNYVARSKEEKEEDGGRKEGNDDEEDDEDEATSGKAEDGGGKKGKEEENWEGWMEDSRSGSVCLFCALRLPSSSLCIDHMRLKHDFDLVRLAQEKGLDFFARVRLINYIRRNRESDKGRDWSKLDFDFSDVQLLFPVLEDDELLQHEFEHIEDSREAERLAVIESARQDEPPEDLNRVAQVLRENE